VTYFTNDAVRAASIRHGIAVEAHSPLGHGQGRLLADPVIRRVAAARDKTSAQIQRGGVAAARPGVDPVPGVTAKPAAGAMLGARQAESAPGPTFPPCACGTPDGM
jgi:hypothetical protein